MTIRRTACRVVLAGAIIASAGFAQESIVSPPPGRTIKVRGVDIDFVDLAPPLEVKGMGDAFRRRTPVLGRGDIRTRSVDPERLYARRLAMMTEGRMFHDVLPTARGPAGKVPPKDPSPPKAADPRTPLWKYLLCAAFLVIAGVLAKLAVGKPERAPH